ncbi:small ribosomal subunit protein uS17-like [Tenrec ecaudatus]|uniref:small ribosomal subunit protein uS17-like n=1 Tax=Tenrec ecaudatus TaxID=94439 RepID=UPI003F5A826D
MADIQSEHPFQKKRSNFQNQKKILLGETGKEELPRYYKNIILDFEMPKKTTESTYIDTKCPFNVSIRGRILSGAVAKMKRQKSIVIHQGYLHYIREYNLRRAARTCMCTCPPASGTSRSVTMFPGECWPLCKNMSFYMLRRLASPTSQ